MLRTDVDTLPAPYTFTTVGILVWIHIHLTCFCAKSAIYACMLIQMHSYKAHLLEQAVKCPERAYVFAERPVDEDR